jgi:hypothetical protein
MEEMAGIAKTLRWLAVALLAAGAALAHAQGSCTFTDAQGNTVTWPNCQPPAATPSQQPANAPGTAAAPGSSTSSAPPSELPAAKAFPFPGEPVPAANQAPGEATQAPATGAAGASDLPAAKKFPFPGEPVPDTTGGDTKPAPPGGSPLQDAGSSGESSSSAGESSSSSSSSSSGLDNSEAAVDDDAAAKAAAARHAARKDRSSATVQTASQREDEDLSVAEFYMNDKDYKGAYMRALDAVTVAGDDPDAHLALAQAARKLGKLDEAEKHFRLCLSLDPVPKTKKAAEQALKEMAGG